MTESADFEAEGLLDGLQGKEREARVRLLSELAEQGVEKAELRRAVEEDRLALLPVERVLAGGGGRYTVGEIAERAELERDFLDRLWRSLGLALEQDEEGRHYTDRDLESAQRVAALREAGLPDEGILEVARLLGMSMSQLAAANRTLIVETFLRQGDTEHDVARRFVAAAEAFAPMIAESLGYVLNLHLREQIRHDTIGAGEASAGQLDSGQKATVCFADMVGFTRLGESLAPEELGVVTGRLGELASDVVEPPVRLVKLIGDAAMLVGPEPGPVLEAALDLVEAAGAEGDEFPVLRAGLACGPAIARAGDWYGRPVNLASRITAKARPGSVLVAAGVQEGLEDAYRWSYAGERGFKGIDGKVELYRCRRKDAGEDA